MPTVIPYIPQRITVHLGPPGVNAANVTVPFADYVKNVASSEIYPTWDESALRANILAIVSFALNRIYTEWYRNKGYNFTITSSTAFDHKWIPERNIYDTISVIVDGKLISVKDLKICSFIFCLSSSVTSTSSTSSIPASTRSPN